MIRQPDTEQYSVQPSAPHRKPRIAIVDDNYEFLEELEKMLSLKGYDVTTINDSNLAFEEVLRSDPDVVLLDLKMSPKSGFEVAHELRQAWLMKDVPIIAMTGFFTKQEHVLLIKICGIKNIILKPFDPADLLVKLEFALDHRNRKDDAIAD